MTFVRIDLACNDPDNGIFAGRLCQVNVGRLLDLTARNWSITSFRGCPSLREGRDVIAVSGKRWPIVRSEEWVGNWCWNGYWMREQVARQFLVWLHGTGRFQCEGGDSDWASAWDEPSPLPLEPDKDEQADLSGLGRLLREQRSMGEALRR
jgi:hypothetical protein